MEKKNYGDEAFYQSTVFERYKRFKRGEECLEYDERNGRPRSSRSPKQIMKLSGILKRDIWDSTT